MKKYRIVLSALLVCSLFNIQMNEANAKGSVVIDSGTAQEHTIPADVTGSVEPGLDAGFVQTDSKKLNFEKVNLEGISLEYEARIIGVHDMDDGNFLVGLKRTNYNPANTVKATHDTYLLHVNPDGVVLKSLSVATGEVGTGTNAIKEPSTSDPEIRWPVMQVSDDEVFISYTGRLGGDTSVSNLIFSTGIDLSGNNNTYERSADYSGPTTINRLPLSQNGRIYDSESGSYTSEGSLVISDHLRGHDVNNDGDFKNFDDWQYVFLNLNDSSKTEQKSLKLRTYEEMGGAKYEDMEKAQTYRAVSEIAELSNGNIYGMEQLSVMLTSGRSYYSRNIVIWDQSGNVLHRYEPTSRYHGLNTMFEISNENEIYFRENNQFLRKINVNTGVVTTVKEFPVGTSLTIIKNENATKNNTYFFYGYAGNNTGAFEGYGSGPGAVIGAMNSTFDVTNASIIKATPTISMGLIQIEPGKYFSYGNLGTNNTFANIPTDETNGIVGGSGWIDKPSTLTHGVNNNVYMGSMKNVDDYAPAIKVGDAKTVNVEELSADEVEKDLLASVEVYDSFETSPNNPSNSGLTAAEMQANLEKRLNANPEKLEGPIDWKGLGLDTSKVGYNDVKFFITDTNNQITADSKIVNVIKNSTEENSAIAIDANNFHMNLADVASLDDATSKTNAKVIAWDMGNGDDLIGNVTVDAKELAAIQSTKEEGIFDLTFTVTKGSDTVSNTVKVFVGGTYDPTSDIVIFAHNFDLMLKDAASYPGTSAVAASEAKAYIVKSNTELDSKKISADVAALNAATKIGPYPVELTYTDGTLTAKASVIANVFDETVVEGDHDAIGAKNIVFDVAEVKAFSVDELRTAIIARSGVTAWDTLTGEPVAYEFDESVVLAEVGEYSLTFITENGTEKTIIVYVAENPTCDNGCDSVDATEFITAQDFYLTPNEVAALTEEKVIVLGNAKATNIETGENLVLSADYGKIKAEAGSYDVTYTTESGLSKTVKATVGNNLVDDNGVALAADNVVMWDYEVAAFNNDRAAFNDDLVLRSKARAWLIEDNSTLLPVTADSAAFDMADLTPYSYSVVYNHENTNVKDGVLTTDARLTIKGKNTVVGEEDAIDANDFALIASEVEGLTDKKVIELANARAWLIADGSKVEITEVDFSLIEAKKGVYDVTFTSSYGTSTTVQAFVGNKNRPTIKDGVVVFADDYTKKLSELPAMTLTDHIEAADATAIDQDTYEELEITHIDVSNVLEAEGQYPAEFGVEKNNLKTKSAETQIVKADSVVTITDDSEKPEVAQTGMTYLGSIIALLVLGLMVIVRMSYRKLRR